MLQQGSVDASLKLVRIQSMDYYDVDAYETDHGWVARATRLDPSGQDEVAFCSDLGFESETKEEALRCGEAWVSSRGGRIRRMKP